MCDVWLELKENILILFNSLLKLLPVNTKVLVLSIEALSINFRIFLDFPLVEKRINKKSFLE